MMGRKIYAFLTSCSRHSLKVSGLVVDYKFGYLFPVFDLIIVILFV